jgi:hypothetical protein
MEHALSVVLVLFTPQVQLPPTLAQKAMRLCARMDSVLSLRLLVLTSL